MATDAQGNTIPGIFLLKNDYGTNPPTPNMPRIKLKAKLRQGAEEEKEFIKKVRWEIALSYQINVPGDASRATDDKRSRSLGRVVRGECDGFRIPKDSATSGCPWGNTIVESALDEEISLPWQAEYVGGGELQIRAIPVNANGDPISPSTDGNLLDPGNVGLVFLQDKPYVVEMSPGSLFPRIEGELMYPPSLFKTNNPFGLQGYVVNQKDSRFCQAVVEYLRNPTARLSQATTIWQRVGHLGQPDLPDTKLFFQVLSAKELKTTPYAHFKKFMYHWSAAPTGQPAQAAYPALSEISGSTDGGFGMMQLTKPPPTYSEIWHWRKNIDRQIDELTAKLQVSEDFFKGTGDPSVARQAQKLARFSQGRADTLMYRMEMYARNNGVGLNPYPNRPTGPVPQDQVPGINGRYPFNAWDTLRNDWVPRVTRDEAMARTDGGIRYAYDALDIEANLLDSTPASVCGGF